MKFTLSAGICTALLATFQMAQARITKITIARIEAPTFEGRSFGNVGQYEKLVGRIAGEIDPADPHNAIIADVDFAPRNASGKVEYETDIMILRPVNRSAGNHKLWYELTNRGTIQGGGCGQWLPDEGWVQHSVQRLGYHRCSWRQSLRDESAGRGQSRPIANYWTRARRIQHR